MTQKFVSLSLRNSSSEKLIAIQQIETPQERNRFDSERVVQHNAMNSLQYSM